MELEQIISLQKARMGIYGDSNSDLLEETIFDNFEDNPSYRELSFNGKVIGVHFISNSMSVKDNSISRQIIPKPPVKLHMGDMVVDKKDVTWLCVVEDSLFYNKIAVVPCNHTLKWQDISNNTHTIPCMLADKTSVYSDGLSKTAFISLGTDQISILVQANEETLAIPINKRFIFKNDKNNIYEVNRRDTLTMDGLISFVVKKSLYDPILDNLELNLANYNGKQSETEAPDKPIEQEPEGLIITGLDRFIIYDKNIEYSVNTDKEVIWTLSRTDVLKFISKDGNKCVISPVSTSKIGKTRLRATLVEDETIFVEKEISITYA